MKLGIRGRLFLVSLALIVLASAVAALTLEVRLRASMAQGIETTLEHHARAARALIERAPLEGQETVRAIDALADTLGASLDARVTVVDRGGRVLGDSRLSPERIATSASYASRPEIAAAQQEGLGVARRYSTTLHTEMLYVAVPFSRPGLEGTVRVALPLDEVDAAATRLRAAILFAALIGIVVALLMSALASHLLSRTLRALLARARAVAPPRAGDGLTPDGDTEDEIRGIRSALDRMARELEASLAKLAAERDRLGAILEGMSEAVLVVDARRRVRLLNARARALFGVSEEAIGRPLSEVVRAPALHHLLDEIEGGRASEAEIELPGPLARTLVAHGSPGRTGGDAVVVLHDITRLRHLERVRRDFVANVSHELRTPVAVISANAETLLGGALDTPDRARPFVEGIHRHARRLTRLIADLLDLSRIEAGEAFTEIEPVEILPVARRARDTVARLATERKATVELTIPEGLRVEADAGALEQVLVNLLENALKYGTEGGHVALAAHPVPDGVRIEVCDDGPGVPEAHRARIFERFYRVDAGRSRAAGGTGLGLAIVRNLVEGMGGRVGVEAARPHGACFWLVLRAA